MPASAAGEPSSTLATTAPKLASMPRASARSGVRSWIETPMRPRRTSPCAISCVITADAMSMGTAKPMPTLPPAGAMIAVLIPTSWPFAVTSAPPELPGLIEASVWMKSSIAIDVQPAAAQRADDAGGDGLAEPERITDGDHAVADAQTRRIAQPQGGQV